MLNLPCAADNPAMASSNKIFCGSYAVSAHLEATAHSILELDTDVKRRDTRLKKLQVNAKEATSNTPSLKLIESDSAGGQAVIATKDHAKGVDVTVAKVASAVETVRYLMVTNLTRTLNELKEPVALVLGTEDQGMRQLTRKTYDELVRIPILDAMESLNVPLASAVACTRRRGSALR
jgi:23S rRNA (guanosine2251-2'-O)-methyltransferase